MGKTKKGEWIAKNDITGKTYGKPFESIYDCQQYIDTDLVFLQYEWKQLKNMEESYDYQKDYEKWYEKNYPNNISVVTKIMARMQYALKQITFGKSEKGAYGRNVIRCYNIKQNRWAEGMDY